MSDILSDAIAVADLANAAANADAPKGKPSKPKAEPKAKAKAEPKAKAKAEPKAKAKAEPKAKPAPAPTFEGFAIADGADVSIMASEAKAASEAFEALASKDKASVEHYLAIGRFASMVAPMFKSTKIYGQYLAEKMPASQSLDPALRSNCKWLSENLSDVLVTFGINRIEDYKSANPTVIRRDYKAAKEASEIAKAAEEAGMSVEEAEAAAKAAAKAEKEAAAKAAADRMAEALEHFRNYLMMAKRLDKMADGAVEVLATMLKADNKAEMVESLISQTAPVGEP